MPKAPPKRIRRRLRAAPPAGGLPKVTVRSADDGCVIRLHFRQDARRITILVGRTGMPSVVIRTKGRSIYFDSLVADNALCELFLDLGIEAPEPRVSKKTRHTRLVLAYSEFEGDRAKSRITHKVAWLNAYARTDCCSARIMSRVRPRDMKRIARAMANALGWEIEKVAA